MKALCIIAGVLIALYGGWHILMVYAFSSMLGQDLPDAARNAEQARAVTDGMPTIGLGVALIVAGAWLAFSKPRPHA